MDRRTGAIESIGKRDPVLRVVPRPADINANGHIFGGWVFGQMDIAGGIVARGVAKGAVATVAVDAMEFLSPILMGDVISVYAAVERRGRTSVAVRVDVFARRSQRPEEHQVTSGLFTFVALNENSRPRPLPDA